MKLEDYRQELQQDSEYVVAEKELEPFLDLADDVLKLRLERGWSQSELARRAGTQQSNISRIESGLSNPTIRFLQKLANAFDAEIVIRLQVPETAQPPIAADDQAIHVPDWPLRTSSQITSWTDFTSASSQEGISFDRSCMDCDLFACSH